MHQMLFTNRRVALAFAFALLVIVRSLVGTQEDGGILSDAASQIETKVHDRKDDAGHFQPRSEFRTEPVRGESEVVRPRPVTTVYPSNRELVERAEGFNPDGESAEPFPEGDFVGEIPPDLPPPDIVNSND